MILYFCGLWREVIRRVSVHAGLVQFTGLDRYFSHDFDKQESLMVFSVKMVASQGTVLWSDTTV